MEPGPPKLTLPAPAQRDQDSEESDAARGRFGVVVDDDRLVVEAARAAGRPALEADWEHRPPEAGHDVSAAQEVDGAS